MAPRSSRIIKYRDVKEKIAAGIERGDYVLGQRLPSEKDLALAFEVSIITVRQAVELLSREGYVEKVQGSGTFVRHLRPATQRAMWGLALPSLLYPWYPTIAEGLESIAASAHAQVMIFSTDLDERPGDSIRRVAAMGVQALAVLPSMRRPLDEAALLELHEAGFPFVFGTDYLVNVPAPRVLWDLYHDGRLSTEHLLGLGHRRIAFLSQPPQSISQAVFSGYRDALIGAGLSPWPTAGIYAETVEDLDIYRAARALLALAPRPTAIVTTYEVAAHIACRAALDVGLRVPEDLSVMGYGGVDLDLEPNFSLSTVDVPKHALGAALGRVLIALLKGEKPAEETSLPGTLRPGRTSAPPPPE
jgi:DNA-binding LacI/PurR family transcriptional regulator